MIRPLLPKGLSFAALGWVLAASALAASAQPAAAPLARIGAAGAVRGRVTIQSKTETVGRVVQSGKPIYLNDHVTTGGQSGLQVMLLDETVFTLGPDADMVLDEFVYDPTTSAGKVTANVVKGAFRFVSGKIAHDNGKNMKVRVPGGTMGIRGTIAGGETDGTHTTLVLMGPGANNNAGEAPGAITVEANGASVTIDRPGFGTTINPGQPPAPPAEMGGAITTISGKVAAAGGKPTSDQHNVPEGPSNPTQASGQTTASAAQSATTADTQQDTSSSADAASTVASQDFSRAGQVDGVTSWEQLGAITSGQDQYSMSGTYSCSGGSCSSGVTGTATVTLVIDWGARTLGGNSGSQINLQSSGAFNGDTSTINIQNFGAAGSTAGTTLSNLAAGTNGGSFSGTTITLMNVGGVVARDATATIHYTGTGGESAGGSATGSRAPFTIPQ